MRSRVFVLSAIALCLVACSCAHANSEIISEEQKEKEQKEKKEKEEKEKEEAVEKAQDDAWDSAEEVSIIVKRNLLDANKILQRLDSHKRNGEFAAKEAEKKAKGNAEAEAVAREAKSAMEEFNKLHTKAKSAAQAAVNSIKQLVNAADTLANEVNVDMFPDSDSSSDYTELINKSSEFKARAKALEAENTEKAKLLETPGQLLWNMSTLMEKAQLAFYQVCIIVSRTEIDNVLNKTDIHIRIAEEKRNEVNATVNEIMKLSENAPDNLSTYCTAVLNNENGHLDSASSAVDEAKKVQKEMLKISQSTSDVLENVKKMSDVEDASYAARTANKYAEEVTKQFPLITKAVMFAEISVSNANSTKESFKRTLLKSKGEAVNKENKTTEKPEEQLYNATEASENGSRVEPTLLNSEKTVIKTSEDLMQQASDKPTIEEEEEKPKNKKSENFKDKLRKSSKNVTKIPVVGGNVPALGDWSDRSMTLSLPLLAALIASAALH